MKRRITFLIGSLTGGGAERVTCNLANYLNSKHYKVEILTMSDVEDEYALNAGIKKIPLIKASERRNSVYNAVIRYRRLGIYMKRKNVDCYVVMLPITVLMMLSQKRKTKAKVIASERNDPNSTYSRSMGVLQKHLASKADGYIFQTEDAKKWYGDSVKHIKTAVIPNAINPDFIGRHYSGERRKIIAGVGRLKAQKNFELLIKTFSKIADEFPDYNLVIYGEGEKREELENLIKSLNLQKRISLPGNIQNIADEMEKNSLFVLSSDFEGMPNALMEAMALGIPCISTDCPCGGPRYLINNGKNGILVPVGDADKMAAAVRKVLSDPDYAESLSKEARKISERLAPEKIYGKWESFINEVITS